MRSDDALKELRAALSIEPSPDLAAKVRARVRESSSQRPIWAIWIGAAAAAAAAAAIAVAVWPARPARPARPAGPTPPVPMTTQQAPGPRATGAPATATPEGATMAVAREGAARAPENVATSASAPSVRRRTVTDRAASLQVLVPPDEKEAVDRWLSAFQSGAEAESLSPPRPLTETGALSDPAPIAIAEIKIAPLPNMTAADKGSRR